jgi:hypothetical protein
VLAVFSVPMQKKLNHEHQRLLNLYEQIAPNDRAMLLAFAEFLIYHQSANVDEAVLQQPLAPKEIERPAQESVVKAIKRLSARYYMLQREHLLDETSSLMMAHIMHGQAAHEVIDELEVLFDKHYQDYLKKC